MKHQFTLRKSKLRMHMDTAAKLLVKHAEDTSVCLPLAALVDVIMDDAGVQELVAHMLAKPAPGKRARATGHAASAAGDGGCATFHSVLHLEIAGSDSDDVDDVSEVSDEDELTASDDDVSHASASTAAADTSAHRTALQEQRAQSARRRQIDAVKRRLVETRLRAALEDRLYRVMHTKDGRAFIMGAAWTMSFPFKLRATIGCGYSMRRRQRETVRIGGTAFPLWLVMEHLCGWAARVLEAANFDRRMRFDVCGMERLVGPVLRRLQTDFAPVRAETIARAILAGAGDTAPASCLGDNWELQYGPTQLMPTPSWIVVCAYLALDALAWGLISPVTIARMDAIVNKAVEALNWDRVMVAGICLTTPPLKSALSVMADVQSSKGVAVSDATMAITRARDDGV